MKCAICQTEMDPALAPETTHPSCIKFSEPDDLDPAAAQLKQELIDIIIWADQQNPRTQQQKLGPSEIGGICDRRLGYRMAGLLGVNVFFDPWAAIVGTAVHTWLGQAIDAWCAVNRIPSWLVEKSFKYGEIFEGHSDLYRADRRMVIDHKTVGPDVMKKILRTGPPPEYVIQVQIYGLAFEKEGFPVEQVALVFYPRAGLLKNLYVWVDRYNASVAEAALHRIGEIAGKVIKLQVLTNPSRWQEIEATPSNACGFCPWYDPNREFSADDTGCPGR